MFVVISTNVISGILLNNICDISLERPKRIMFYYYRNVKQNKTKQNKIGFVLHAITAKLISLHHNCYLK